MRFSLPISCFHFDVFLFQLLEPVLDKDFFLTGLDSFSSRLIIRKLAVQGYDLAESGSTPSKFLTDESLKCLM